MAILPTPVRAEGQAGIEELVAAIERRCVELGLARPWSIAELRLDDEDYATLGTWAGSVGGRTVRDWMANEWRWADPPVSPKRSRRACLGLLLLTLSAEAARREATEATLWRFVRRSLDGKLRFRRADADLFVQGQPREVFKDALHAAVAEFGLRHVLDEPDTKRYYLTIFLQFGFGLRDARNRLSAWLTGQPPLASVQRLADRKAELGSTSFASIWKDLRSRRGRFLTADDLLRRLRASAWVLPGWAEELAELASRVVRLSTSSRASDLDGRLESILEKPRLTWPSGNGAPHFTCNIGDLTAAPFASGEFTLRVGGRVVARIESDGDRYEACPDVAVIPGFPTIAAVELRDEELGESDILSIECFNPREPVSLFDLGTGRPVEEDSRPDPRRRYALVFADDLTLSPDPSDWRTVRCGILKLRVAALQGDVAAWAKLASGGVTVWEAQARSGGPAAPSWATVTLEVAGELARMPSIPLGTSYEVLIKHPADVRVAFVRRGMEALELNDKGAKVKQVGPVTSSSSAHAPKVNWLIGLERGGETARISRDFEPLRHGGAILRDETWEILHSSNALDAGDAKRSPVLIIPPERWGERVASSKDWAVMEGEALVDRPGTRPRPLLKLLGLGGRLTVRYGPFNAVPATPPDGGPLRLDALVLAARVVDRGVVRGVQVGEATDDAHAWRIELERAIEIDEDYAVQWWDRSGEVYPLKPSAWPKGEPTRHDWWSVEPPPRATEPRALVVTYRDARLGAWWAEDWADKLAEVGADDPGHIAELLAWFKLPALGDRSLPEVRRLAERFPAEVLRAWISNDTPEGWRFVVRAAFREWRPGVAQVDMFARGFGSSHPIPEVAASLWLAGICPILMGRFLRARADGASVTDMRLVRTEVRAKVEASLRSEVRDPDREDEAVHDAAHRITGLDVAFLKNLNATGIKAVFDIPAADDVDQRLNLDLAVTQHNACRLLLALDILQSLEAGVNSYWKGGRCETARRPESD